MKSAHIHIQGQVQGVGFRPFVFKTASHFGLTGWVNNQEDGVHIEVTGPAYNIDRFYYSLLEDAPQLSIITHHSLVPIGLQPFEQFTIVPSQSSGAPNILLTPDFGMCPDCTRELGEASNRRSGYPFITCTNCGPRYSIIRKLPYDRPHTTMEPLPMCPRCLHEYHDPRDRRHFSQTNSCPECPVRMTMVDETGIVSTDNQEIIDQSASRILAGEIAAFKGIGGFLLICDSTNDQVVQNLRNRKHRPSKPFALIYPNQEQMLGDVSVVPEDLKWLYGPESPILLLPLKDSPKSGLRNESVAPGQRHLGIMRPYAPALKLLLDRIGRPVVATSGNISESPIVFDDHVAKEELLGIADFLVGNDRRIVVPQDDSVLRFTLRNRQKVVLRRSRGLAPSFVTTRFSGMNGNVLSLGAELKATFGLVHRGNTYLSQYLGDLESYQTVSSYEHTLHHFQDMFDFTPEMVLVDSHPEYYTTQLGQKMAQDLGIPIRSYQHHKAHFAAVLAENQLLDTREPVLGIIWDGTGWGDDQQIWGGEFIRYSGLEFERMGHLSYYPHILGDKMAREPRISALSITINLPAAHGWIKEKFSANEWSLYRKMAITGEGLTSSSMGRLFDGVASTVGLIDQTSYEGEAAMLLENAAMSYRDDPRARPYGPLREDNWLNDLFESVIMDLKAGFAPGLVGMRFHRTLVEWIRTRAQGFKKLAFSGGVFQNALLVDLIIDELGHDFELYFHRHVSPNDECISLGQLACYQIDLMNDKATSEKDKSHVFSNIR